MATILDMVALTRQDCMIGSAAIMRQALVQAIHHARHRQAFGKPLSEQDRELFGQKSARVRRHCEELVAGDEHIHALRAVVFNFDGAPLPIQYRLPLKAWCHPVPRRSIRTIIR